MQDTDPIHDMGVGFDKKMTNRKAFKVLKFIASKGEDGASLTEIQYFIWTKLKKYPKKDFWEKSLTWGPSGNRDVKIRATRGYWADALYGTSGYYGNTTKGLLPKYCKKNPITRKWVLKRWPKPGEKLFA